jgi:hypothetical protein
LHTLLPREAGDLPFLVLMKPERVSVNGSAQFNEILRYAQDTFLPGNAKRFPTETT